MRRLPFNPAVIEPSLLKNGAPVTLSGVRAAASGRAFEDVHHRANSIGGNMGILRLAVSDPPVKPLDLCDDKVLSGGPARRIIRQAARRQLRVLAGRYKFVPEHRYDAEKVLATLPRSFLDHLAPTRTLAIA
jgi:hypothetical protein